MNKDRTSDMEKLEKMTSEPKDKTTDVSMTELISLFSLTIYYISYGYCISFQYK